METRIVHAIAGTFILASLFLGIYVSPNWFWLTGLVGVNLWIHALTNWCFMILIIRKFSAKKTTTNCCS